VKAVRFAALLLLLGCKRDTGGFTFGDTGVAGLDDGLARRAALLSLGIFLRHLRPEFLQKCFLGFSRRGAALDETTVFENAQVLPS